MKLTINSIELTKSLEQAAKFVSAKPLIPILDNLKLVATQDCLLVTGFNLVHGIEIKCVADVIELGSVCTPISAISIIKNMVGQLIIETNETNLITVSTLSSNVEIQGQSTEEYPDLISEDFDDLKNSHSIDSKLFAQALKCCIQTSSTDESKSVLTGVNITCDSGKLRLMATDGHRLAVCNFIVDEGVNIESKTIPARSLAIADFGDHGTVKISIETSQFSIDSGNRSIMRTLEGKYPDAMLIVPSSFTRQMKIDRRELINTLNIMSAISSANNLVNFAIASDVANISSASDGKRGNAKIDCILLGSLGEHPIDIAFNLKYLLDSLKMFNSKQVTFSMNEPLQPVVIRSVENDSVESDVDLMYLIMPVQIRK